MITTAKITDAPISGLYTEKIYDAPISTKNWTWIKFETNEYETFYGQFKGAPLQIALSKQNPYFYVLLPLMAFLQNDKTMKESFEGTQLIQKSYELARKITLEYT